MQQPALFTFSGFFRLTRTGNLFIVALTQLATAAFLLNKSWSDLLDVEFILLMFSTGAVAASGYIINDYYDVKIDYVNKPERVIVGKLLKRRSAMVLHLAILLMALIIGFWISPKIGLVHFTSSTLLWLYSNQLKRLPFWGNLIIAILTSWVLIIVGIYFQSYPWILWIYASFAFFFTLWREIIKDMEDRAGDERFGCRTLPIIWGIAGTKKFIFFLMALFTAALVFLSYSLLTPYKLIYIAAIIASEAVLAYSLYRADKVNDFRRLSALIKWIIVVGICSMVLTTL